MARKRASARPAFASLVTAGVIATAVASVAGGAVIVAGVAPGFAPLAWLGAWVFDSRLFGAVLHAIIGVVVLPLFFRGLSGRLPVRRGLAEGLVFGALLAWLSLFLVLPALGVSLAGLILGWPVPVAVLFVQLVYGATLAIALGR